MAANTHTGIEIVGLIEEQERLKRILATDPTFERQLQKVIDQALVAVRKGLVSDAASVIESDPRHAQRAVRRSVYKRILGGQVNILKKRRAGKMGELPDADARQYWRRRSYRTGELNRYQGSDRGFILRFLNKGTAARVSPTMDNHPMYRQSISERPKSRQYKSSTLGYRGRTGRKAVNFFDKSEQRMMQQLPTLEQLIGQLIAEEFNK